MSVDLLTRCRAAFPATLAADVEQVHYVLRPCGIGPVSTRDIEPLLVDGECVSIPYRLYIDEPLSVAPLSTLQRHILACLFTRHHDGFVRARHVASLLTSCTAWSAPFLFALIGEYVVEIIVSIERNVSTPVKRQLTAFAESNPAFTAKTRRRVISYWNCYYRWRYPEFAEYPGFRLLQALGAWPDEEARSIRADRPQRTGGEGLSW